MIKTECNLAEIVFDLLNGKTVVFPTETSYGLGCDATNQTAVDKIFKIKNRRSEKPLLVVVPSVEVAKKYLVWNDTIEKIASKYWPGPVTVVGNAVIVGAQYIVPLQPLAAGVVSKDNTVAVRVSAYPLLKSITEKLGKPLVATSANISDTGDMYSAAEIVEQFQDKIEQPDIIFDYGELPEQTPTTVVSAIGGKLTVLRQGKVKIL